MNVIYQPITQNNDWIILIFLFVLGGVVILKNLYKQVFYSQLKLLNNPIWISNLKNNYSTIYNVYNAFNLLILCIVLSLITLFYVEYFKSLAVDNGFYFFLKYFFYFGIFFLLKHLLYYFFSLVFDIKPLVLKVVYIKTTYLNFLGLFILLWLPFVFFSSFENLLVFKTACIISLILAFYFFVLVLKNNLKVISKHFFYFILYLCTLEIAPIIIFYRVFF